MCPHCHTQGERNGHHLTCQNSAHTDHVDSDFVGMMNLYQKEEWQIRLSAKEKTCG
ncbi:MAG: hypothetical protein M1294_05475 [Firmicutes bacterium]|nr:hypothetical protein [Bacillota bacterium]MCL5013141.1 hypothetical protein [Bacillota bacterium]